MDVQIGSSLRDRGLTPCGPDSPVLIIANVGTSRAADTTVEELAKAQRAVAAGAAIVTDHSFVGDLSEHHRRLTGELDALVSYVSVYELAAGPHGRKHVISKDPIEVLDAQANRGIDILTIHATFLRRHAANMGASNRLIPSTSKGGGIIARYMRDAGAENPYYERFDEVLDICRATGLSLSLGSMFRAASVMDAFDDANWSELRLMGELVDRARAKAVPIMVEGLGHSMLSEIPHLIAASRVLTHDAPYRVLPMATDRALGLDHIAGAIAAAACVQAGASLVCAMGRSEHIGLPSIEDIEEAVLATKVAVACGELARGRHYDAERQMARTRWTHGCKGDWSVAVDPTAAQDALRSAGRLDDQLIQCGMCGDHCGITAGRVNVSIGRRLDPA